MFFCNFLKKVKQHFLETDIIRDIRNQKTEVTHCPEMNHVCEETQNYQVKKEIEI